MSVKIISKLKQELDKQFSIYIRLRDCLKTTGTTTRGKCFTCDKILPFKKLQCGHFISRKHNNTRYDEQNCYAQCAGCNVFKHGNYIEYTLRLIEKYSKRRIVTLQKRSQKIKKFTVQELESLIKKYKKKIACLKESTGT